MSGKSPTDGQLVDACGRYEGTFLGNMAEELLTLRQQLAAAPAWRDRPTCPGWWYAWATGDDPWWGRLMLLGDDDIAKGAPTETQMVYGPVPNPPGWTLLTGEHEAHVDEAEPKRL